MQVTNYIIRFKTEDVIFGNYVPPIDPLYFNHGDFSGICDILTPKYQLPSVLGGGDMKLNLPSLSYGYRSNPNKIVNSHGRELLKIVNSHGRELLKIVNSHGRELLKICKQSNGRKSRF